MCKGENALALFEDYVAKNIPPPDNLLRPEMPDGFSIWYEAFWRLSRDRNYMEGGVGPIPFSSILNYPGIAPDELDFFCEVIEKLDAVWMREYNKGAEAAIKGRPRKEFPRKVYSL